MDEAMVVAEQAFVFLSALADMRELARAASFLTQQEGRGLTHELVITPAGERCVP